jgi:hypothetical protein
METLNRRVCIKTVLGSLAVAATGVPALAALPEEKEKKSSPRPGAGEFWKRVDSIKARDLVDSAIKAARAQVESRRAVNTSRRATVLLGADAGKEFEKQAEMHHRTRTTELQRTKRALPEFLKGTGKSGESRFASFVRQGGLKELTDHARESSIQAMLHSDASPEEARSALKGLDERLAKIRELKTFQDLTSYFDQHLDELTGRKMSEEKEDQTLRAHSDHYQHFRHTGGDRGDYLHLHIGSWLPGNIQSASSPGMSIDFLSEVAFELAVAD